MADEQLKDFSEAPLPSKQSEGPVLGVSGADISNTRARNVGGSILLLNPENGDSPGLVGSTAW